MLSMKQTLLIFLFLLPFFLYAEMDSRTVYTEDRFFITTGKINFIQSREKVSITLLKYNDYDKWAFKGMDGVDNESEGLIISFTDIEYSSEQNLFFVTFDINVIWPFGKKGNVMKFEPHQNYDEQGYLESITLIPLLGTKLVEEAEMVFSLRKDQGGVISLFYESRIKLSKFLDFFFSLRSYKKNFEWYVVKMSENLYNYLEK